MKDLYVQGKGRGGKKCQDKKLKKVKSMTLRQTPCKVENYCAQS